MKRFPSRPTPALTAVFVAAIALASFAPLLVSTESRAQDPAGSTSSVAPSASTAPSAASSASAAKKGPVFSDELPPDEKSDAPNNDEWKTAPAFEFDKNRSGVTDCTARRIREWIRVTCNGAGSMASIILGDADGFRALTPIPNPGQPLEKGTHWLQFPFRRGDRKLFELRSLVPGNYGDGLYVGPGMMISAMWLPNERPLLTAH
jgi:hypothetical protein